MHSPSFDICPAYQQTLNPHTLTQMNAANHSCWEQLFIYYFIVSVVCNGSTSPVLKGSSVFIHEKSLQRMGRGGAVGYTSLVCILNTTAPDLNHQLRYFHAYRFSSRLRFDLFSFTANCQICCDCSRERQMKRFIANARLIS